MPPKACPGTCLSPSSGAETGISPLPEIPARCLPPVPCGAGHGVDVPVASLRSQCVRGLCALCAVWHRAPSPSPATPRPFAASAMPWASPPRPCTRAALPCHRAPHPSLLRRRPVMRRPIRKHSGDPFFLYGMRNMESTWHNGKSIDCGIGEPGRPTTTLLYGPRAGCTRRHYPGRTVPQPRPGGHCGRSTPPRIARTSVGASRPAFGDVSAAKVETPASWRGCLALGMAADATGAEIGHGLPKEKNLYSKPYEVRYRA